MSANSNDNETGQQYVGGSEEITSSKKECTSCEQNNINNITEGIDNMVLLDDVSKCASCGKEGISGDMNTCNKCKGVKYCNAACKKKHRSKHKKKCERRVAELHDEQLFKEHPLPEECPICMLPLPHETNTSHFMLCCGKSICIGCSFEMETGDLCAFCRMPEAEADEENIQRVKKLMDKGNADAFNMLGNWYDDGEMGLPQDYRKANELFLKAGELGCAFAYNNLGVHYNLGQGVEVDKQRGKYYLELAAMMGSVDARFKLGNKEARAGNERAKKHYILGSKAGHKTSLEAVKKAYEYGLVTKDEYASTLRAYHERQKEMKSDARDKAAAGWAALDKLAANQNQI